MRRGVGKGVGGVEALVCGEVGKVGGRDGGGLGLGCRGLVNGLGGGRGWESV